MANRGTVIKEMKSVDVGTPAFCLDFQSYLF